MRKKWKKRLVVGEGIRMERYTLRLGKTFMIQIVQDKFWDCESGTLMSKGWYGELTLYYGPTKSGEPLLSDPIFETKYFNTPERAMKDALSKAANLFKAAGKGLEKGWEGL